MSVHTLGKSTKKWNLLVQRESNEIVLNLAQEDCHKKKRKDKQLILHKQRRFFIKKEMIDNEEKFFVMLNLEMKKEWVYNGMDF